MLHVLAYGFERIVLLLQQMHSFVCCMLQVKHLLYMFIGGHTGVLLWKM